MSGLRSARTMRILLAASLLLNLFFAGFVVSRIVARSHNRRFADHGPLMAGQERPMREVFMKRHQAFAATRQQIHQARKAVRDALVAEPLNTQALASALKQLRDTTNGAQVSMHEALIEAAKSMSQEERQALADSRRLWQGPPGSRGGPLGGPHQGPGRGHP